VGPRPQRDGTLEAHGVTANGADILAPVAIARAIAPRLNAFVAPAVPYGFTGSMDAYPGAFTVPEDVYRAYVRSVLVGLARNRFRNLILVNGHGGGQTAVLGALAHLFLARERKGGPADRGDHSQVGPRRAAEVMG
jgi:creatinine amidohydrolase